MFEIAFAVSLLQLLLAERAIRLGGGWIVTFILVGLLTIFLMSYGPNEWLFLSLLLVVCLRPVLQPFRRRSIALGTAYLLVLSSAVGMAWSDSNRLARLREQHPVVSLEERIPIRHAAAPTQALTADVQHGLTRFESDIQEKSNAMRQYGLRSLHESTVDQFISSPGFGVARGREIFRPSENNLKPRWQAQKILPQPHRRELSAGEAEDPRAEPLASEPALENLHRDNVVEFVNPEGFGYVREKQVAGFVSHQFRSPPAAAENWSIATVDLVGLLLSESPRVYESKNLPRMDELKNAPTRPLDRFERDSLEKLKSGEDLIVASTASGVRMLGAIRSAKQCLQCHQGNRGDLLGAFTYRLERKGKD